VENIIIQFLKAYPVSEVFANASQSIYETSIGLRVLDDSLADPRHPLAMVDVRGTFPPKEMRVNLIDGCAMALGDKYQY
jgi:hypothetical protein